MAWRILEGFDGLASYSEIGLRSWRSVGAGIKFHSTNGRRGGACLYDDTSGSTTSRGVEFGGDFFRTTPNLVAASDPFEIGFAFKITGTGWDSASSGFAYPLVEVRTSSAEIARIELYYSGSVWQIRQMYGATQRTQGNFPGGGGSGTRPTSGRWYYVNWYVSRLEAGATVSKTNTIYVDNSSIVSAVGTTQNATSSSAVTIVRFCSGNGASCNLPSGDAVYFDDIVMLDGASPKPATSGTLGPVRVDKVVGTAENTFFDDFFTASSGGGNDEYPMLDDSTQDGDTTYVYSSTPTHTAQGGWNSADTTQAGLPVVPGTIHGIRAFAVVKNAGDGVAVVRCDVANSSASSAGSNSYSLPAGGSYEGMMSYGSAREPFSDATSTLYVVNTLRVGSAILRYVS